MSENETPTEVLCIFDKTKICNCPLRDLAYNFGVRRDIGVMNLLTQLFDRVVKDRTDVTEGDIQRHQEETNSPKADRIAAQEALRFIRANGENPHKCPYFSEDIAAPGRG